MPAPAEKHIVAADSELLNIIRFWLVKAIAIIAVAYEASAPRTFERLPAAYYIAMMAGAMVTFNAHAMAISVPSL